MSTYSKEWHYEYCMGETECKHGDPECPHNHFLKDEKCECKPNKDSDNQTCQFCGVFAESEKQLAIHIEMRHQNKDSLREAVMSILGSSINFEGLADDWYIKHTEDTDKILSLLTSHIEEAERKARIETLKIARHDVDFAYRWNENLTGVLSKIDDRLEQLKQTKGVE